MNVFFTADAEKNLKQIRQHSESDARRILQNISSISEHSAFNSTDIRLTGEEKVLVLRIDEFRVFYTINDRDIYVLGIADKSNN